MSEAMQKLTEEILTVIVEHDQETKKRRAQALRDYQARVQRDPSTHMEERS